LLTRNNITEKRSRLSKYKQKEVILTAISSVKNNNYKKTTNKINTVYECFLSTVDCNQQF